MSQDWSSFDWQGAVVTQGDLIPGDPYQIAALGKRFRDTANAIDQQAANLKSLVSDQGFDDSDSGRAFAKQVGDTADLLQKAFGRYNEAADALGTNVRPSGPHDEVSWRSGTEWASTVELAQVKAQDALNRGKAADADSQSAQRQIHTAQANALPSPTPGAAPTPPNPHPDPTNTPGSNGMTPAEQKAHNDKAAADALVAKAGADIQHAIDIRDREGKAVAGAINDFINTDGLKDPAHHWWDIDWATVIADIGHIAGAIAGVAGILALALSWVPVVGEVLGAIALVAGAVALVCDTISALDGKGNWFDVAIDVVGLLSCGAGRAIGNMAKASRGMELFNAARAGGKGITEALDGVKGLDMGAKDILQLKNGTTSIFKIGMKNFGEGLGTGPFKDVGEAFSKLKGGNVDWSFPGMSGLGPNLAGGAGWKFGLAGWSNATFPLGLGLANLQIPENFKSWEPGFMGPNVFHGNHLLTSEDKMWEWKPLAPKESADATAG
ncbi:hypothetical protein ABH926_005331 [Catenulispora sp. GP43]|uniref:putative T7SS-secreted protein n=1 Tax=Catenulispora sp. GP43 TaxID=3156263 RepID=UPI0035176C58